MKFSTAQNFIASIKSARENNTDAQASTSIGIYPTLKGKGELVKQGTRINWNGAIKRASVDLWDTEQNTPDAAPALWEDIEYREGIRIIPQIITAVNPFSRDDLGWWGNTLYKSLVDYNIYTPEQYAPNWEVVDNG